MAAMAFSIPIGAVMLSVLAGDPVVFMMVAKDFTTPIGAAVNPGHQVPGAIGRHGFQ